jgi:hypothetical protein
MPEAATNGARVLDRVRQNVADPRDRSLAFLLLSKK